MVYSANKHATIKLAEIASNKNLRPLTPLSDLGKERRKNGVITAQAPKTITV